LPPPAFGAKLARFDGAAPLKAPGVEKVVKIENGVAVVAKHFWAAKLGRDAVVAEWEKPEGGGVSTDALLADYRKKAHGPGVTVASVGDAVSALSSARTKVIAEY